MAAALTLLRKSLFEAADAQQVFVAVAHYLTNELFADGVIINDRRGGSYDSSSDNHALIGIKQGKMVFREHTFSAPIIISNSATSRIYYSLENELRERNIRSFAAIPLMAAGRISGVIEIQYRQLYQRWQRSDLHALEHLADLCSWALDRLALDPPSAERSPKRDERVQALYELSRSLTVDLDPAIVALRGLRSLMRATHSTSGVCVFIDHHTQALEIVAAEGLSARYVEGLSQVVNVRSLMRRAVDQRESFRIANLQVDSRAARDIAADEGLRATIVVPLVFENSVYGALSLFHRDEREFSQDDFELVSAAANQICLIARQAEYYSMVKKNAQSLSVLYQLTHELSKHFSPKEVAEHAFPIIQEQFSCKRMWLAALNEKGTHLEGQAGFGPGLRRRIVNVQIQLSQPHQFLDQALETRAPVIVPKGERMECSGIRMIVSRLELGTLVILPLVSLGQLVGVLILEPESPSVQSAEVNLSLLSRMAGEIATVILARRFESRMASDDKMRTAGLLASGVAHNFNNLLQAIMGQSSLIEMQLPKDSPLVRSAQLIVESSHRGAGLIKQLVACTVGETQNIERIELSKMIEDSRDFYRSILGSPIELQINAESTLPAVMIDYGRVQQTVASILVQAKDSIGTRNNGQVELAASSVRIAEVDSTNDLLPGVYASIRIRDNGVGLDKEQQARIFEPFFARYNEEQKNQLGGVAHVNLSAAHALIRNYGGTITLSSTPEGGSEYTILIPEAAQKESVRPQREPPADLSPGRQHDSALILLDVDEAITASVTSLVDALGFRTVALRKRLKVRDTLNQRFRKPPILMIDTDRSSEDIVGFIREVAAQYPTVKILISTFDPKRWSRLLGDTSGIEMLAKPLSIFALDKVLRNVIQARATTTLERQVERSQEPAKKKRRAGAKRSTVSTGDHREH